MYCSICVENRLKNTLFVFSPLSLSRQEALKRGVVAQECIHHKPCAEAEAGDEGVQLGFAHEFGVDVTEAEEQRLVLSGELLGELFLQIVQRVGDLFYRALGVVAAILWVDVAVVQLLNDISPHCPSLHFCSSQSRSMWRRDLRVVALCSSVESQSIR